ncbi:MAG: hypothetical protein J6Y54_09620 [Lentisphaeria bacterium]|nr:hypothetical protein [Lentisphaeria bacterium]
MRSTALSVAAAMLLAVAAGCRDDAEPPREEDTENPAPKRPPKRREPAPKRPAPQKPLRPRRKPAIPAVEAPAAPDKKSGSVKEKGKVKDSRPDGKEKGKNQSGQPDGRGKGKNQGGQGNGGNGHGNGGSHGGNGNPGGQGGHGGNGNPGGQGGHGGGPGGRLPKGWENDQVTVPPADSEKQIWDMMVAELVKLAAGPAEFAPLGASQTSLKRDKNRFHATGRCTFTDASGARSGHTFSCDFAGNGYEVTILRVEFRPAGGD